MVSVPYPGDNGMPVIGVERLESNLLDRMLASRKSRQHLDRVCQNADRNTNSAIREADFHQIFKARPSVRPSVRRAFVRPFALSVDDKQAATIASATAARVAAAIPRDACVCVLPWRPVP